MSKQPWALILGASSGFGAAAALELARAGMNIFGVHLDRRDKLPQLDELQAKIRELGRDAVFFNVNASDDMAERIERVIRESEGELLILLAPRSDDGGAALREAFTMLKQTPDDKGQPIEE